ncbi:hypothetical protein LJB81_00130 [Desulfovibrio sp. OttesenSCG-928-M14]|nr:hypothetical protein [Desulfovibrio sp. OttesenSCG-928-M14]MDL2291137.1 hypothetical protein [Desulfovibrio sp. OttesenSCG-928-F20]
MKKALVLMFSFLICMTFVVYGNAEASGKTEYYKLTAVISGSESMTGNLLAEAGMDSWYIVLNPNGSGVLKTDKKAEFTWAKNTISAGGESLKFAREGSKLTIMDGEDKMEFTLSSDAPPAE